MELDLSQPKVEEEERYFWPIYQKVMVHLATPAPSSDHCTAQFYILIMPISLPYYIFHDTYNILLHFMFFDKSKKMPIVSKWQSLTGCLKACIFLNRV